jgi:glycosyltransferase involved in cell wall biosynthesis
VIVSPYNLEPRKNLTALCECVALIRRRYPNLTLVLFGGAALTPQREAAFETRLQDLGLAEAVVRPGLLDDADLAALYHRGTVFAFPSLYEGFGLPVLEAMACGASVIARGVSAMAEVVGKAGLLLETADQGALTDGIAHLLENSDLRARLGAAARERAATFTIERMARLTFASYEAALRRTVPEHALSALIAGG